MKKILSVIFALIFLLITTVDSAYARPAYRLPFRDPINKFFSVSAPDRAKPGEVVLVEIAVENFSKDDFNVQIRIPKTIAESVSWSPMVAEISSGEAWIVEFDVQTGTVRSVSARIRIRKGTQYGLSPLIFVYHQGGRLVSRRSIFVEYVPLKPVPTTPPALSPEPSVLPPSQPSEIEWSVNVPPSVMVNTPIEIMIEAKNPASKEQPFEVLVELSKLPTDGTVMRSINCGSTDLISNETKSIFPWRGSVPAYGSCTFRIFTISGKISGTYHNFLTVMGDDFVLLSNITVVAPVDPSYGKLIIINTDFSELTEPVLAGTMYFLEAHFFTLSQGHKYVVGPYSSTCPMGGFPTEETTMGVGTENDFNFGYFVYIPGPILEPPTADNPV